MRALFLLALILLPSAGAWSVRIDAPPEAGVGLAFLVAVCAEATGAGQIRILARNATLDVREDRYLPPFDGAACTDVEVMPANGTVELEARVRSASGGAPRAKTTANISLLDLDPVALPIDRVGTLRAPMRDGWALFPAIDGLPPPSRVRIVEAHAPPHEGVLLANDGPGQAHLGALLIANATLPNITLAPGETTFVETPVRPGAMRLTAGARVLSVLDVPRLKPGEGTAGRYGRTDIPASMLHVPGDITIHESGSAPVIELIDGAKREVLVEAYTLTSPYIAGALARAADRGAQVRVLLEGAPVGGVSDEQRALVATLQARGADVLGLGGAGARYRTVHSKLIVVDRLAVSVATENLGESTARGYGLIVEDAALASRIAEVIEADMLGHDIRRFEAAAAPGEILDARRRMPDAMTIAGANVTLVLSPDDPEAIARLVRSARQSVTVEMLRADPEGSMVDALIEAARQGAAVRMKLDGRFDDGTNRETAARLNALARRESLDMDVTIDTPARTLHAKAIAVDSRAVYVGSMNWVRPAIEDNREAGLIVEDEELARWLEARFERKEEEQTGPDGSAEVGRAVPIPPGVCVLGLIFSARAARRLPRPQA